MGLPPLNTTNTPPTLLGLLLFVQVKMLLDGLRKSVALASLNDNEEEQDVKVNEKEEVEEVVVRGMAPSRYSIISINNNSATDMVHITRLRKFLEDADAVSASSAVVSTAASAAVSVNK